MCACVRVLGPYHGRGTRNMERACILVYGYESYDCVCLLNTIHCVCWYDTIMIYDVTILTTQGLKFQNMPMCLPQNQWVNSKYICTAWIMIWEYPTNLVIWQKKTPGQFSWSFSDAADQRPHTFDHDLTCEWLVAKRYISECFLFKLNM